MYARCGYFSRHDNYQVLTLHKNYIDTFSSKGVWKKARKNVKKSWGGISGRHRIGLLSTRLQQAVLLNSIKEECDSLGSRGLL